MTNPPGGKFKEVEDSPDGGWGWMVVFASFMVHVVMDGVTYSFGILYIQFLQYFNEGAAATAWIASLFEGVINCSGPLSSILVNKYGCQAVSIAGAILGSTCLVASMFAKNVLTLCFTIGIGAGLGFGLIYLPAIVSVTCWFKKKRSLATGIAVAGTGFGIFIFSPLTNYLFREFGWRGGLLLIAGLVLQCATFGALFRPVIEPAKKFEEPKQNGSSLKVPQQINGMGLTQRPLNAGHLPPVPLRMDSKAGILTKKEKESHDSCAMLDLNQFKDPVFIIFTISSFCNNIGYNVPYVYVVAQAESRGIENADFVLSVIGIAHTIGGLFLGYICDKTSQEVKLWIYNGCLTLCGIATTLSVFCDSFFWFAVFGSVFGFTMGADDGLTSGILVDLLGLEQLTNAFGMLLLFQGIASLLGPPIAGWLYDATQSYDPGFILAGIMIALSGIMLFVLPSLHRWITRKAEQSKATSFTLQNIKF